MTDSRVREATRVRVHGIGVKEKQNVKSITGVGLEEIVSVYSGMQGEFMQLLFGQQTSHWRNEGRRSISLSGPNIAGRIERRRSMLLQTVAGMAVSS